MNVDIGDWVLTKKGNFLKIISDEMENLPFQEIKKKLTNDEIKEEIKKGSIDGDEAIEYLNKRMYIFVPYNISEIQKGIQAGHAVEQYSFKYNSNVEYVDYIQNHKTWIILNGGTTNSERDYNGYPKGLLNKIADDLLKNDIKFAYFNEPDLNNALSAVCFIADERVFNNKDYPDFDLIDPYNKTKNIDQITNEKYKKLIGGKKNLFLRELLKNKKLA